MFDAVAYAERFSRLYSDGVSAGEDLDAGNTSAIAGMGGSIIAGMAAKDITSVPVEIINGYDFPPHIKGGTLIASSYSGNTEETLMAVKRALARGMEIVAITSGGMLGRMAKRKGWATIKMPEGMQPREAFPFSLGAILSILGHRKRLGKVSIDAKRARKDARRIFGKIPLVISHSFLSSAGYRFKTQLNENSKTPAFHEVLPEMNHNSINAVVSGLFKHIKPVFIRDREEGRNGKRYEAMKKLGFRAVEIHSTGRTRLERYVSVVLHGDAISYLLADMYGVDPVRVEVIERLKKMLSDGQHGKKDKG